MKWCCFQIEVLAHVRKLHVGSVIVYSYKGVIGIGVSMKMMLVLFCSSRVKNILV